MSDETMTTNPSKFRLFDPLIEGVLVASDDGKVLHANPSALKIFELTDTERRHLHISDLFRKEFLELESLWNRRHLDSSRIDLHVSAKDQALARQFKVAVQLDDSAEKPVWLIYLYDASLEHSLSEKYKSQLEDKQIAFEKLTSYRARVENFLIGLLFVLTGFQYIAIQYSIKEIPPIFSSGTRFLIGGLILNIVFYKSFLENFKLHRLRELVVPAILTRGIGLGGATWSLQYVPSGLTSVFLGSSTIWFYLFHLKKNRTRMNPKVLLGLIAGVIGIGLITYSGKSSDGQFIGYIVLLLSTITYTLGLEFRPKTTPLGLLPVDLYIGGIFLLVIAAFSEPITTFSWYGLSKPTILGFMYSILFVTVIGDTAFVWLMNEGSLVKSSSHMLVRPVTALLLGWLLEGEVLTMTAIAGTVLIMFALRALFKKPKDAI
ncbi:MAG: EamA family transporter [Bdellovibrionales bacterium]|nr:EamA family transporter [Bdellovibrionales bacterium]